MGSGFRFDAVRLAHTGSTEPRLTMGLADERSLVQRVAAQEDAALRELYTQYAQRMYAYALRLLGNPAAAEDVVQDALIAVWRSAGRFRGEGRLIAWLLGIVHHTAMKALRHRHRPISDLMAETLPDGAPLPEEQVAAQEKAAWVRRGLANLSPNHRAALELVFYQGLSLAEAAHVCRCPVGTIKSRLSYARRYLRELLDSTPRAEDWR